MQLQCHLIAFENSDSDALRAKERLVCARLAQQLLNPGDALLLFDEAEDIFASSMFARSVAQSHKAWINNLLENNKIPTVWIVNQVSFLDPAFVRRFDVVLEMTDLPVGQRERLIADITNGALESDYVRHFAREEGLLPAILQRGLRVAASLPGNFGEQASLLFNQTLQAQGKRRIARLPQSTGYSPAFISCSEDLQALCAGLQQRKQGRLCLYGPPGTGKTAWAGHLAEVLEMPLLLRNGSDLLGKYVGETEQNIAAAFHHAREQQRVLLLDEEDGFLFARHHASHNWERTMINEMLTQIERFDGVLVVTTNLMDTLDQASLRRFDLKVRFEYLSAVHIRALACAQAERLAITLEDAQLNRLLPLTQLTPGDFAAVARRHQFAPFANSQEWVDALIEECRLKQPGKLTTIGFLS